MIMIYDQKYENGSSGRQNWCDNFEAVIWSPTGEKFWKQNFVDPSFTLPTNFDFFVVSCR